MTVASELHIIMPGVCGPLSEIRSLENNSNIKHWVRALSRAHCEPSSPTVNEVVTSLFNLSIGSDFPSAVLTMLALNSHHESESYMFADPVHLQADMDRALLTSSKDLGISDHEAEVFCAMLNQHFDQDGLRFITIDKNEWVVASKDTIKITTTPLVDAIGRNVNFILPEGEGSGYWKQKLTEAQMLMYSHDINASREGTGQQSINSLWLHGSGRLPGFENCRVDSVCSDDILFKGLASHVQCDYLSPFASADDYVNYLSDRHAASGVLNVLHLSDLEHLVNYADVNIWTGKLEEILNLWIYPLLKMAHKNNIKVTLYPCNGQQYQFSKFDAFKFWRQEKLSQHISSY